MTTKYCENQTAKIVCFLFEFSIKCVLKRNYAAVLVLYTYVVERFVELGADFIEVNFIQLFLLCQFVGGKSNSLFLFGKLVNALQKFVFHIFTFFTKKAPSKPKR